MRWSALLAVAIALVAVVATAVSLTFLDFFGPIIVLPLSLGTFAGVGLAIALRRPGHPIGWLFLVAGACWTLWFALPAYAWRALVAAPGTLPAAELAAWLNRSIMVPAYGSTLAAVVLFPTGRPPSRAWVPVCVVTGALLAASMTVSALAPEPTKIMRPWVGDREVTPRTVLNPVGADGPLGDAMVALKPFLNEAPWLPLGLLVLTAAAAAWRFARSSGVERIQLKWFFYAASFSLVLLVIGFVLPSTSTVGKLTWGSGMAALGLIPMGAGIAILRHRLFDIDLLISRTLSYGALSAIVVGIYLVAVTSLGALLRRPEDPLVSAGAALVLAVVFNPLRVRVQRAVDHLVYGRRDEPYAVIGELGRRLGEALDPDAVLPAIAGTVAESLRLPYVAVELNSDDGERIVAFHGRPGGAIIRLPLVYQQETVGHLLVSPRAGEAALGHQDVAVLEALGRQAGVAAHGVRLTAELRRARERLVVAREEERRRLLRDLHDELGPRLASQTLMVHAVRTALGHDRGRADALLADLEAETRRSLEEVRRIARGLRPPALDELGLADALRDAAERCASSTLTIEVDVTGLEATPAAVETAAYHVAREALANVVRHADARHCRVRLHRNGNAAVVLEIEDDGRGVPPEARAGVGLESMRERAAEIGGRLVIEGPPGGGTRVLAVFPLGSGSA